MSLITGTIAASVIIGLTIAGAVAAEGAGGTTTADQGSATTSTFTVSPDRIEFKSGAAPTDDSGNGNADSAKDKKKKPKTTKPVDKSTPML